MQDDHSACLWKFSACDQVPAIAEMLSGRIGRALLDP